MLGGGSLENLLRAKSADTRKQPKQKKKKKKKKKHKQRRNVRRSSPNRFTHTPSRPHVLTYLLVL